MSWLRISILRSTNGGLQPEVGTKLTSLMRHPEGDVAQVAPPLLPGSLCLVQARMADNQWLDRDIKLKTPFIGLSF